MSVWTDFGFRENPYSARQLPATEEGEALLVGRDDELRRLKRLLTSTDSHPTIEGDNGVGKSSLVAIAGYQTVRDYGEEDTQELLIPIGRHFQLTPDTASDEFVREVYFAIAQAFIDSRDLIRNASLNAPDTTAVEPWLNRPLQRGGAGVSTPAGGISTPGKSANTSAGYDESGFQEAVRRWLEDAFPSVQAGAFLCVIDNLELLDTSQAARQQLEVLRDSVLSMPGLRWVLCGARGIVRSAAASPRLSGLLAEPMEVGPISDEHIPAVVERRIETYALADEPFIPVDGRGFLHIYHVLSRNLRDAFQYCERFSLWLDEEDSEPKTSDDRFGLLEVWLTEQADRSVEAARNVKPRAWQVFDQLSDAFDGVCSPSDFVAFGFESNQAMRPHIRDLEDANLVKSKLSDEDQRRKTIAITPTGWLVAYARRDYVIPETTER